MITELSKEKMRTQEGIGLIGTVTFDEIYSASGEIYSGLGGILYQAAVLSALEESVFLFTNLGEEIANQVEKSIRLWPSLKTEGIQRVRGPGNRVVLRYPEKGEREEILESVVPSLGPEKVLQHLDRLRMLVCVLNSGFDISLEDWRKIVDAARCPLWLDVHSLILSRELKVPRKYLTDIPWESWIEGVTYLQANKIELACLMGQKGGTPTERHIEQFGRKAFELGLDAVFITLGKEGVWVLTSRKVRRIAASQAGEAADTTGCGDVFGAVAVKELAEGANPFSAAEKAVEFATQAIAVKGVEETFALVSRIGRALHSIDD